jgi:hypothetical protein
MQSDPSHTYSAFVDGKRLATGPLHEIAVAVHRARQADPDTYPLIINDATGQSIDLDLRGDEEAVVARYTVAAPPQVPKVRGRPKLGVVAREVTLLPEHWDWLAAQPGGASVALRKIVHAAQRSGGEAAQTRQARDRAYHAMSTLAGDLAGFEEASRALFAGDHDLRAATCGTHTRLSPDFCFFPDNQRAALDCSAAGPCTPTIHETL